MLVFLFWKSVLKDTKVRRTAINVGNCMDHLNSTQTQHEPELTSWNRLSPSMSKNMYKSLILSQCQTQWVKSALCKVCSTHLPTFH